MSGQDFLFLQIIEDFLDRGFMICRLVNSQNDFRFAFRELIVGNLNFYNRRRFDQQTDV